MEKTKNSWQHVDTIREIKRFHINWC